MRIYYYDINGTQVPDVEYMSAFLLDEGVLFISPNKDKVSLCINVNDYFCPGSDGEFVTYDDIPVLFKLYEEKDRDGIYEFVANKRGIENKYWKDKLHEKRP